jgi:hypothetical protein
MSENAVAATYALVSLSILSALVAVGILIAIKVMRRTGPSAPDVMGAVPASRLEPHQAARVLRRYLLVAGVVTALLLVVGLILFAGSFTAG